MKTRFVVILVLLNAAALAAGYVFFSDVLGTRKRPRRERPKPSWPAWKARVLPRPKPLLADPAVLIVSHQQLQLEPARIDRLPPIYRQSPRRRVPRKHLKDIILTEVMRLYAQRRVSITITAARSNSGKRTRNAN